MATFDAHVDFDNVAKGTRKGASRPMSSKAAAFRRAQSHSRRVAFLKKALPALGVAIIAAGLGAIYFSRLPATSFDFAASEIRKGKLIMANPKLEGLTGRNLPYVVSAMNATQTIGRTDQVRLDKISGDLPLSETNRAQISADSGIFDNENRTLLIDSPLEIRTTDGMTARMKSAFIDIDAGTLEAPDSVDIAMKGWHVSADKLTVRDRGKLFRFENNVRVTLEPSILPRHSTDEDR